jgi:hypothetical protein
MYVHTLKRIETRSFYSRSRLFLCHIRSETVLLTMATMLSLMWKRAACAAVLLLTLYMISDDSFSVFTALNRHEPSLRIFRSLLQVNLILWASALSLYVWSRTVSISVLGDLFFQPLSAQEHVSLGIAERHRNRFSDRPVVALVQHENDNDSDVDDDNDDDGIAKDARVVAPSLDDAETSWDDAEDGEFDAHYESDGEVEELVDKGQQQLVSTEVPSALSVASAALDMLLLILVTLFFFTISSSASVAVTASSNASSEDKDEQDKTNKIWNMFARVAAPIFPLLLFIYLGFVALFPWNNKRGPFWMVISLTLTAPWHDVSFRDGFIGDILTSSVRPLQDIAFTISYLLFGLRGWWSQSYLEDGVSFVDQADANVPEMERSWLLHTVILPTCMVSPLWWRFMQNLRQCHDYKQRWPYLGNALKYFLAAQVAMFGVFHPTSQQSSVWLACFVVATLYQVWWDVFMDWGLLVRKQPHNSGSSSFGGVLCCWQLRSERLYSRQWVYWTIAWVNLVLRFCWTLSFLPPRYLNAAGVLTEYFSGDLNIVLGSTIATAEIIRRMLWGLLRFEWEAIKETRDDVETSTREGEDDRGLEMTPMKMGDDGSTPSSLIPRVAFSNDMSSMNDIQVLGELGLYAGAFCLSGMVMTAHRGTA